MRLHWKTNLWTIEQPLSKEDLASRPSPVQGLHAGHKLKGHVFIVLGVQCDIGNRCSYVVPKASARFH
jgi:hypothetical protein